MFVKVKEKKRKRDSCNLNWTKRSILFELPHWDKLLLRHNIDVMHVEKKNLCDNLLGTILDIAGKTKDTDKAILDLENMNIRRELYLIEINGRCSKSLVAYVFSRSERVIFCHFLKSIQVSDGFASNLSRNFVEEWF